MARGISGLALVFAIASFGQVLTKPQKLVSDAVSAQVLEAHVRFLADDLLEGRSTPSRGLDLAANYIAAQFRLAGLEPAGDDGYFQTVMLEDLGSRGLQMLRLAGPGAPRVARNVAGILRGSDPQLRDTYVMLTAHYDHRSMSETGDDRIFNGANDDASGTASVMEIARVLASLPTRPKRSILFVTFFGEERGLVGSRYYGQHPLVPAAQTIADLNLEQVGRTDATDGPQVRAASITGFEFSTVPAVFVAAGKLAGVNVFNTVGVGDRYFARSDNQALADLGIPAHTLSVAYDFPDYHQAGDTWEKLDYVNMAAIDRAVALGLIELANSVAAPAWNAESKLTQKYVEASKKLHAQ